MPRRRSFAPARKPTQQRSQQAAGHAPARTAATPVQQQQQPGTGLIDLQRLAGNRAVQATLLSSPSPRPGAASSVQRLISPKAFKTATDAGFLSGRGKTMKTIDKLLEDFAAIHATGKHLQPGADQDKAINILEHIIEDVAIWKDTHEGDTSRSRKRIPGMTALEIEAKKELTELKGIREKGREFMGMDQAPVKKEENKLKTEMEGSISSVFSKLGPVFSAAAPTDGDTAEAEIAIKIPVDPNGVGYLGFRVKASVERLKKQAMKMRFELAVVGGAKIGNVAEIGGELGGYMEAQGATPEKTLELLSYGLYRRVRESKVIPNEVANFMWGGSATSVGWKRAEKWSAQVEKENFKAKPLTGGDSDESGAYVETGALAGVKAKGGVGGVAELEGGAQYSTGQKYDLESVKGLKGKYGGSLGTPDKLPTGRFQVKQIGESVHHLEFGFGAKGGPFSGALKVGVDWSTQQRNEGLARLQAVKVGLEAAATLPFNELIGGGIAGYVVPLAASVAKGIRAAATGTANDKRSTSQNVGEVIGGCENGAMAITQLAGVPKEAFIPKYEVGGAPPGFAAPVDIKLSLNGMYDFFEKKWVFEFKLEYIKGIEVNAGVFEMKVKKGQRLLRVMYDGGTWTVD